MIKSIFKQRQIVFLLCLFAVCGFYKSVIAQRNILSQAFTQTQLQGKLSTIAAWRLEQKNHYLQKVAALPDSVKARLVKDGERGLKYEWPSIPASLYLDYKITGNRYNFERKNNERSLQKTKNIFPKLQMVYGHFASKVRGYFLHMLWFKKKKRDYLTPMK